ncbi:MAG: FAD-binding oxidoreductase [Geminicoccaceae bacterium]
MDETSYYHRQAAAPGRPPLTGPVETEIAIVGGGLAGLAVALSLAERGTAPVLIEAATLASGASGRNGGMVSAGFTAPLPALERRLGVPVAERLMRASLDAISLIRARIARHAIACAPVDGLVIASWFDEAAELHAEAQDLNERFGMRLSSGRASGCARFIPRAALLGRPARSRGAASRPARAGTRLYLGGRAPET